MSSISISQIYRALRRRPQVRAGAWRFVNVDGTRVRVVEAGRGTGAPPLLLIHGFNGSADYWYPHGLPELAAQRRVIAFDLPGNGFSGRLREGHTLESYARFIGRLLDHLQISRADVLGHSMGGQLAIAAAAHAPERFRCLVLVSSTGLPDLVKRQWTVPFVAMTDACVRHVALYPTYLRTGLRARSPLAAIKLLRDCGVRASLRAITAPTLIVWGEKDRVVPISHGCALAAAIPGACMVAMRGAGHMPFYQKPQEFSEVVLGFLRDADRAIEKAAPKHDTVGSSSESSNTEVNWSASTGSNYA